MKNYRLIFHVHLYFLKGIPINQIIRKLRLNLSRSSRLMSFFRTLKGGRRLTRTESLMKTITGNGPITQTTVVSRQIRLKNFSDTEVISTNRTSACSTSFLLPPSITRQMSRRRVKRLRISSCSTAIGVSLACAQLLHSRR